MSKEPICPSDEGSHPREIENPPGQDELRYRVGEFNTFRDALLRPREGEQALAGYRPSAGEDLALQLLEWWAYLADVLTFYNERIANSSYLRTTQEPGGVERLVRMLGYRPRPGIGATGVLAALTSALKPITLPQGLPVQSKPGPGQQPEVFELDLDTEAMPGGAVPVDVKAEGSLSASAVIAQAKAVIVRGVVTGLKQGDEVLVLPKIWASQIWSAQSSPAYALATIESVEKKLDARGNANTRVTFDAVLSGLPPGARAGDYSLLRSDRWVPLYSHASPGGVIESSKVRLATLARGISVGELILFQWSSGAKLDRVQEYKEVLGYANAANPDAPETPPQPPNIPIPIPHARLSVHVGGLTALWSHMASLRVRFNWFKVGDLLEETPAILEIAAEEVANATLTLVPSGPGEFPPRNGDVLIEDATERGVLAQAQRLAPRELRLSFPSGDPLHLKQPLRVLYNLVPVSRGKRVPREVLGSGDASLAGQSFELRKSPLTYLSGSGPEGYRSTLRVWVDGYEWKEVRSFHGQPRDARVFVTQEDERQKTRVIFGDGVHGARLPAGNGNVVASYRYGSGAGGPGAGALVNVLTPQPGLLSFRNPVPVGGGDDPYAPEHTRRYAPRSVLTFGRAVSADDYEAIAVQAPGVARARAYYSWDPAQARTMVKIYVGDSDAAVTSASTALRLAADPSRPLFVELADPKSLSISMTLVIDARYEVEPVVEGVKRALLDREVGLFGERVARIGARIYRSQIYEACLRVPGARAVQLLTGISGEQMDPGEGCYFTLSEQNLTITPQVEGHG